MEWSTILLILHVLGACIVVGVVFLSFVVTFVPNLTQQVLDRMEFIGRFGMPASVWQFITGVLLVLGEKEEFMESPIFWTKMALYVIEGSLAGLVIMRTAKKLKAQLAQNPTVSPKRMQLLSGLHLVLLVGIVIMGVLLVEG